MAPHAADGPQNKLTQRAAQNRKPWQDPASTASTNED